MLIGRDNEKRTLKRLENSDERSKLVCVYGRRRVGKTFLITETFGEALAFHAVGRNNVSTQRQLDHFARQLHRYSGQPRQHFENWDEAFYGLSCYLDEIDAKSLPNGKKIVFLDEFPWFDSDRSDFMDAFISFWNSWCVFRKDILVIICGSATSWMVEKILNEKGGLFDRAEEPIVLDPFNLAETKQMLENKGCDWNTEQIIECQMIFGGLPYFLDMIDPTSSLSQNVNRLCFAKNAPLRNEATTLLEATLRKSKHYGTILKELSEHKYGIRKSDLEAKIDVAHSTMVSLLKNLQQCGYIQQYRNPVEAYHPIYVKLIDPFILFHYHFLAADVSDGFSSWTEYQTLSEGRYNNWRGNAFEILCFYHIDIIKKVRGIAAINTPEIYPWKSTRKKNGAQIDMVIERADHVADLYEMKFTNDPFELTSEYAQQLQAKRRVFKEESGWKGATNVVLISVNGVSDASIKHADRIAVIINGDMLVEAN